ncbi:MAG: hypothetical protein JWP78_366, partial [Mucilaginibacter sp.]|nr:hypothetical protein [Mucilaginibacter sp.]
MATIPIFWPIARQKLTGANKNSFGGWA